MTETDVASSVAVLARKDAAPAVTGTDGPRGKKADRDDAGGHIDAASGRVATSDTRHADPTPGDTQDQANDEDEIGRENAYDRRHSGEPGTPDEPGSQEARERRELTPAERRRGELATVARSLLLSKSHEVTGNAGSGEHDPHQVAALRTLQAILTDESVKGHFKDDNMVLAKSARDELADFIPEDARISQIAEAIASTGTLVCYLKDGKGNYIGADGEKVTDVSLALPVELTREMVADTHILSEMGPNGAFSAILNKPGSPDDATREQKLLTMHVHSVSTGEQPEVSSGNDRLLQTIADSQRLLTSDSIRLAMDTLHPGSNKPPEVQELLSGLEGKVLIDASDFRSVLSVMGISREGIGTQTKEIADIIADAKRKLAENPKNQDALNAKRDGEIQMKFLRQALKLVTIDDRGRAPIDDVFDIMNSGQIPREKLLAIHEAIQKGDPEGLFDLIPELCVPEDLIQRASATDDSAETIRAQEELAEVMDKRSALRSLGKGGLIALLIALGLPLALAGAAAVVAFEGAAGGAKMR